MAKTHLESGVPGKVLESTSMPDTEPGHKGEELNPGDVFDPNAAYRKQRGVGPGLQDSERFQPAHWIQESQIVEAAVAQAERKVDAAQAEADEAKEALKDLK
jgi:hypothetical protein